MARNPLCYYISIWAIFFSGASGNLCSVVADSDLPPQTRGSRTAAGQVYRAQVVPHWFDDNNQFWYRVDTGEQAYQFVTVDAVNGVKRSAFDHRRVAQSLREQGVEDVNEESLPIDQLDFESDQSLSFRADGRRWLMDLATYDLKFVRATDDSDTPAAAPRGRGTERVGSETEIRFVNRSKGAVKLFWLDGNNQRHSYGSLDVGESRRQHSYVGHIWLIVDANGKTFASFRAGSIGSADAVIEENGPMQVDVNRRRRNRSDQRESVARANTDGQPSPDGKWIVSIRSGNLFAIRSADQLEQQLTHDGDATASYGLVNWSPDLKSFVAFRVRAVEPQRVHLIRSAPRGGGRAELESRPYALPGDVFTSYDLAVFRLGDDAAGDAAVKAWIDVTPDVESIDFGRPRIRWHHNGQSFTYQKMDRGHQRLRIFRVDVRPGVATAIVDEQTDTFIWTAHKESVGVPAASWLSQTNELIYASEVDGWRHLYLVDTAVDSNSTRSDAAPLESSGRRLLAPGLRQQITAGRFVVRGIDFIDEEKRQIWFRACGKQPDQDPYFVHYYRVNFDGTELIELTDGNGQHSVQFSPDRRFLVDSYSRVDQPPIHELRSGDTGELICHLEKADISELMNSGWNPPEVFVAKGRDGSTDIWGIICRPQGFDPEKRYPVVEDLYAGPHSAYVPKTFRARHRYRELNDLGFIVVKIDGMGTAHRSKAFHDVCWHNLKDAGFEDRICWMKAAAAKDPAIDLDRVGVYGVSAGGQNAAAALLFHNSFYKVAVAGCGCHDNRMDKASWNEQWMGYPVGPQYSKSSNIDNAHMLRGHLLLIVGEMDRNVPPESTLRFADALIRADKDFEMLVVPNAGHGMGGAYGWRRTHEFLTLHLSSKQATPAE